jgi:hypothetical protein
MSKPSRVLPAIGPQTAFAALLCLLLFVSGQAQAQEDTGYGTDGFLGRIDRGTAEVDRCLPPEDVPDKERTRRASDHYDRGLVLYEEGDYSGAVREFVSSYCDQPHPSAFYNIGQSFERLLLYEKAVAYFERYVVEATEEGPNRKRAELRAEVLKGLPSQIRVATFPEGAQVTLHSDVGVTARGVANAQRAILVRKGRYKMSVSLPGYETVEQEITAEIGQPYSYYFRLSPLKGSLRIKSSPPNARIFVDNRLVGIGRYSETIAVGKYAVTVEAPGRVPDKREVSVKSERSTDVSVELDELPASGRRPLLVASTVGLGAVGGVMFNSVFEQSTDRAGLAALLGTGIGFAGGYYGIPEEIPRGHAWYIMSSALLGAVEGGLVANFFSCGYDSQDVGSCNDSVIAGSALTFGMLGALGGAATASSVDYSTGDVGVVLSAGLWGAAAAGLFAEAFEANKRTRDPMLFAGLNLGVLSAVTILSQTDVSLRRIALIDLAGLGGVVGGVAVAGILDSSLEQLDHLSILGMVSGLVVGTFLTRDLDLDDTSIRPNVGAVTDQNGNQNMALGLLLDF